MSSIFTTLLDAIKSVIPDAGGSSSVSVTGTVTTTPSGTQNVNVTNAAGASAVNIQDGGNSITVDGTVTSVPSGTQNVSTKTDLTPSSPTAATVGVASAQAVAANSNRKGLILVNTSVNTISIGLGATAVLNSGITLYPGGVFQMDEYCFDLGAVNAIASSASSNLAIQEFTT